jgi:hypothetical protein
LPSLDVVLASCPLSCGAIGRSTKHSIEPAAFA